MTTAKITTPPPGGRGGMERYKGYRATLKLDGRSMWFNFWRKGRERPDVVEVLSNLLFEAWQVDQCPTLEEYAELQDIDLHSLPETYARAKEFYAAQQKNSERLHVLLGEHYQAFEDAARTPGLSLQGEHEGMRLVPGNAGAMLVPPGHPMHKWEILEGPQTNPSLVASLDWAMDNAEGDVPPDLHARVQQMYAEMELVQSDMWERYIYGHFANMYVGVNGDRRPESAIIRDYDNDPPPAERHMGYLQVRQFFPNAVPRLDLIANVDQLWIGFQACSKCEQLINYSGLFDDWLRDESDDVGCIDGAGHVPGGKVNCLVLDMADPYNITVRTTPSEGMLDALQARNQVR